MPFSFSTTARHAATALFIACLSACGGDDTPSGQDPAPPTENGPDTGPQKPAPSMRCAP